MIQHHSLQTLFTDAEQRRRCANPVTATDIKAIMRRLDPQHGEVTRVYRGLYARTAYWNTLNRLEQVRHIVRSLAVQHPDWIFCGPTAAIMHDLDCSYRLALPIRIVARPEDHQRSSAQLARYTMSHPETELIHDISVTTLPRTLFDCAARQPLRYALGPLDSALRQERIDRDVLLAYPSTVRYSRRRAAVNRAFSLADGRSENGGESEARGVLISIGRSPTDIQTEYPCLTYSTRKHRVDFLWKRRDGSLIVGEFDGTRKYVDPTMTSRRTIQEIVDDERERQRCLERQGIRIIRMYYDDLNNPNRLAQRLDAAGVPRQGDNDASAS
ncbi:CTP synthase [Bifidobacterium vansinderenii]|uniref:CTP synthase n=1 Tax=Bifidobacterium vansinderenii TaxID=1984871 RepID=A0A229VXH4_9BIFI|nr:CTP synthase [Bifidobacterium vansinderenii]OXN00329.1 CTP synthase [Bifidobacterium vansinderenii]